MPPGGNLLPSPTLRLRRTREAAALPLSRRELLTRRGSRGSLLVWESRKLRRRPPRALLPSRQKSLPSFLPSLHLRFFIFNFSPHILLANKFCNLFLCRFESYSFVFKQSTTWLRKSGVEAVSLRRSLVKIKFGNRRKNLFVFYRARKYVIVCEK